MAVTDQALHQCPATCSHACDTVQCWRVLGHDGDHWADCDQCGVETAWERYA